jgi:signal transduction histidine kinase
MLRSLRLKLALLYFGSALGIVVFLTTGTYFMLDRFFIQQVDLALQYKMAGQFRLHGLLLPAELESAEKLWLEENPHPAPPLSQDAPLPTSSVTPLPSPTATGQPVIIASTDGHESESNDDVENDSREIEEGGYKTGVTQDTPHLEDDDFDGRLSSIFIVPVSTPQAALTSVQQVASPIDEDINASNRALSLGYDLRTVHLRDGSHARLLTYRTTGEGVPIVIQIGRLLDDQDRLLQMYLIGLSILGITASLLITILSWYLSGRSIRPAQRAWDQQQLFIANASHELRAPLTLIRANADFAIRSKKSGSQTKILKEVLGEVDYMNHLVDDLLLLSRLDTHRLKLERKVIDVDLLFQEITRQTELIARSKGVIIMNLKTVCQIIGDPVRMRQVVLILIDNALRFTPSGGMIELGAVLKTRSVDLYVKDNGSGIAAEHLNHVFDRFYQAPDKDLSGSRNNGLGLSIARALVEAQNGRIRIESQIGQGTTIWLSMASS